MSDQLSPRERRHARRRGSSPFVVGLVLIVLGIVFLAERFGRFSFHNWWALFILIPAIGSFVTAVELFQRSGRLTIGVRSSFFGGLIVLAVALIFLLDLSWATFWPLFVLLPGLSLLFSGLPLGTPDEPAGPLAKRLHQPWQVWFGAGAVLLGLGFFLRSLNVWDPAALHPHWWALPIFLPVIGGLITTLLLLRERGLDWAVAGNLLATLVVAAVAVVALLGLDWNLILPVALIAAGVLVLLGIWGRRG